MPPMSITGKVQPRGKGTASIHTQITLPSNHCHFNLLSAFPPFVFLPLFLPTGPFLQCVLPFPPSHLPNSFPLSLLLLQLNFLPHHELSFSFSSFLTSTTAEEHMPFHRTMVLPGRCSSVQFSRSVVSNSLNHGMNHSMPGLPVHHQLPEFTQTHVHRVGDAIQPSHPLSSPSPSPNPSQQQGLFQ